MGDDSMNGSDESGDLQHRLGAFHQIGSDAVGAPMRRGVEGHYPETRTQKRLHELPQVDSAAAPAVQEQNSRSLAP